MGVGQGRKMCSVEKIRAKKIEERVASDSSPRSVT